MKDTQAADIPHYYLYGDNGADVELDLLHVEPIRNRSGPHDWRIRPHSHPDHVQVLLVAKGGGAIRMEDRLLSIVPPAIVVIPAGIVHQIEFQRGTDGIGDLVRLDKATGAELATGHRALDGASKQHAIRHERRHVALHRRMLPHAHVHRGGDQHAFVGGQKQRRGQVVRQPVRHLAQKVGGSGCDDHEVGIAAEFDMPHFGLVRQAEDRVASAARLEGADLLEILALEEQFPSSHFI